MDRPTRKHYQEMLREAFRPIHAYLDDADVQEIMINGPNNIWVERSGITRNPTVEMSEIQISNAIEILAKLSNKDALENTKEAIIDSRVEGMRIAAALPPVSGNGPSICIRKHSTTVYTLKQLLEKGTLSQKAFDILTKAIDDKKNILISGGTSSGKTTILNALTSLIKDDERLIIIEDTREIRVSIPNHVFFESNAQAGIYIRDLVKLSLRYAPDRIIVGEIRGAEAFDLMRAMNSGHEGGLTTIHANNSKMALAALETLILVAGEGWPYDAIKHQIGLTFDYVVQVALVDGVRKLQEIIHVNKYDFERKEYDVQVLEI
jgi:P-type conjugative transfer ATPase TrbB